jgi:asparaginyl-tRNA synthetase
LRNERTRIRDLFKGNFVGKNVVVVGWARTVRTGKNFGFIELNDGSFFRSVQIVFDEYLKNFAEISKLTTGASLVVCGIVTDSPGKEQSFEIKASEITVECTSPADYPLQKKRHSLEFLREIAHLRPRTNTFTATFRVRSELALAIHRFFGEKGFIYMHSPIITGSDCEGAGEMFQVTTLPLTDVPMTNDGKPDFSADFFGKKAALTVSGQLAAETFAMAFDNVYTFGPTFRAENSATPRHAAEFWMVEPEMAFADIQDDMDIAEQLVKFLISHVLENCKEEIEFFNSFVDKGLKERLTGIVSSEFAKVTYADAIEILKNSGENFEYPVAWGEDLQTEHERFLTEKHFMRPVFVTDWPKSIKAFYMRRNDDGETVAAMDLLVPVVGELIGGSQREERVDVLLESLRQNNLDEKEYGWYVDLRRFGGCRHAGFGLGFERLVMYLTGMQNIRDVCAYPRTAKNLDF